MIRRSTSSLTPAAFNFGTKIVNVFANALPVSAENIR